MLKKILCIVLSAIMLLGASFTLVGCDKSFIVKFDPNGGYFVEGDVLDWVQRVDDADDINIPIVKRVGYNFDGWDRDIRNINKDKKEKFQEEVVVTAKWKVRPKFNVTFNGNGGTWIGGGLEEQSVNDPSKIVLPIYQRQGYQLVWDMEYINGLTESATINATWKPNTYNLYFIPDFQTENWGDFNLQTPMQIDYGTAITNLPKPTNKDKNKRLVGWVIVDEKGDKEYDGVRLYEGNNWSFLKDLSVKPIWRDKTEFYTITYNLDGGYFEDNSGIDSFKNTDNDFLLNNPVRVGYDFVGWTGEDIIEPELAVVIASGTEKDLSFTANWSPKKYTILLNEDDGVCDKTSVSLTYGEKIGTLPSPVKEGYVFMGWTYESYQFAGGDNGERLWEIPQAVTLTAVYKRQFIIKFVLEDYSYTDNNGVKHTISFTYNGEKTIENTTILIDDPFYTVLDKYSEQMKAHSKTANIDDDDYRFKYWQIKLNGREYPISDSSKALEKYAVGGVIIIYPVGKCVWYGPY